MTGSIGHSSESLDAFFRKPPFSRSSNCTVVFRLFMSPDEVVTITVRERIMPVFDESIGPRAAVLDFGVRWNIFGTNVRYIYILKGLVVPNTMKSR
jgi:hypothetical protein